MKKITLSVLSIIFILSCFSCDELVSQRSSSDPILDDFLLLDKTLRKNNQIITNSSDYTILNMEETVKTKVQYQPLAEKAKGVKEITQRFSSYVDALRTRLVEESGGAYSEEAAAEKGRPDLAGSPMNLGDKKAAQNIFLSGEEPEGYKLDKAIQNLKMEYMDFVAKLWEDGGIKGTIFADLGKKEAALRELEYELTLTSSENYISQYHGGKTWAEYSFENKPVANVYAILRKFQNDALSSEAAVINFLAAQMGRLEFVYDNFEVFCQSPKPYILRGQTYEAEIALGAYSSQAKFSVSVNGSALKIVDGKAKYTAIGSSVGEQKYTAKISVMNPLTGETESFTRDFFYEVGE